ncbi:hypothetical protein D046_4734B, partial [Vibrio parahaemolyticus V-223/04]
GLFDDLIN